MRRTLAVLLAVAACGKEPSSKKSATDEHAHAHGGGGGAAVDLPPAPPLPARPVGLPPDDAMRVPEANPTTAEKAWLGKQLFFDARLSADGSASCATCHRPDRGWSDGKALSVRVGGATNPRHTPSLYNVGYLPAWGWDGRFTSLEEQAAHEWRTQLGADPAKAAAALARIPGYDAQFRRAFGRGPTAENVPMALAAFVRTIRAGGSAWDRYDRGDASALSGDALEGYRLFSTTAQCALCHTPPLYTDGLYHDVGLESGDASPDEGRGAVTGKAAARFAMKTPTLRGAPRSGPYFHDGRTATLEGAVRLMLAGGPPGVAPVDPKLRPITLTDVELAQLLAFLETLDVTEPTPAPALPTAAE